MNSYETKWKEMRKHNIKWRLNLQTNLCHSSVKSNANPENVGPADVCTPSWVLLLLDPVPRIPKDFVNGCFFLSSRDLNFSLPFSTTCSNVVCMEVRASDKTENDSEEHSTFGAEREEKGIFWKEFVIFLK